MTGLPDDPFERREPGALGPLGDVLAEGDLLLDALREAQTRGRLLDAVVSLDVGDLRAVVLNRLLVDAFRDGLRHLGEPKR